MSSPMWYNSIDVKRCAPRATASSRTREVTTMTPERLLTIAILIAILIVVLQLV
jgi:hypothetical protein